MGYSFREDKITIISRKDELNFHRKKSITREYLNQKIEEFLESGGSIRKLNYLGDESLVDIKDSDDRRIEDRDKDLLRNRGFSERDTSFRS